MKKRIQLSDHFTYNRLLRFSLPSIMMIICTSIYSIVDGFFVSNYVGKTPFAALNLIMPVLMAAGAIGFMLGTGGSAIVSRLLGADEKQKAHESFSLIILCPSLHFMICDWGIIIFQQTELKNNKH